MNFRSAASSVAKSGSAQVMCSPHAMVPAEYGAFVETTSDQSTSSVPPVR